MARRLAPLLRPQRRLPVPAGQRRNRTPIFITGVIDTRGFLAWFRSRCPKGLSAQMKGENLMVVPETADDCRAAVSALRSLDVSKGVSFHTFSLPEDRCARLLIKIWVAACMRTSSERSWKPLASVSKGSCSFARGVVIKTLRRTAQ